MVEVSQDVERSAGAQAAGEAGKAALAGSGRRAQPAPRRFPAAGAIIDLDGTLVDTAADITAAVNAMLAELGREALPIAQVTGYVGRGAEVLVHRVLTGELDGVAPASEFNPAFDSFRAHYRRENGVHSKTYPGVLEGLAIMRGRGLKLAVVTNKPSDFTLPLLAAADIDSFFDLVVSGDTLAAKKPDPQPMLHVCQRFGIAPAQMVAIGDSAHDVHAARAAGIPVIVVPYGYNEGRDVRELDVDAIVPTLREAAGLLDPV